MKDFLFDNKTITGVGTDIEDIARFRKLSFDKNKAFYKKIFTKKEIDYCLKKSEPYQHFAVRFCAKEAFIKASNQEINDYRSIEIGLKKNKPFIKWRGGEALLSLSHNKDKAIAFVVIKDTINLLPININTVIKGQGIIIKPISEDEINESYVSWLNDPKINKFLEVRHKKQSIETIIDYINGLRSKIGCELFAIFTKKEHLYVGTLGLTDYNPNNGYAVYGLMIGDTKAQMLGLGFGGEATILIIEYLFQNPKIRKIWNGVVADNNQSWKLLEFLGFQREGVQREHVTLSSGEIRDVYMYGILRKEWSVNRARFEKILKIDKNVKQKTK